MIQHEKKSRNMTENEKPECYLISMRMITSNTLTFTGSKRRF